jgi:hypothetical protein
MKLRGKLGPLFCRSSVCPPPLRVSALRVAARGKKKRLSHRLTHPPLLSPRNPSRHSAPPHLPCPVTGLRHVLLLRLLVPALPLPRESPDASLLLGMATGNSPSGVDSPSPPSRGEKFPAPVPARAHEDGFLTIPVPAWGIIPVGTPVPVHLSLENLAFYPNQLHSIENSLFSTAFD